MKVIPITLREADEFIRRWHRQHRNHAPLKLQKFSLALVDGDGLMHGAVIIGTPMARLSDRSAIAEVWRLAADGTPNACSMLLGAASRVCKQMGYRRLQMVVEPREIHAPAFLKASGFRLDGKTSGNPWHHRGGRLTTPGTKHRWVSDFVTDALRAAPSVTVTPTTTCAECRTGFVARRSDAKFCGPACRQRAYRKRHGGAVLKESRRKKKVAT